MEPKTCGTGRKPIIDHLSNCRCTCDKIIAQVEGNKVVIKCRHCKHYIEISTNHLNVEFEIKIKE